MRLTTERELALDVLRLDAGGVSVEKAVEKCAKLRNEKQWPHVRFGRFDVRYTDEQVAQIVRLHSAAPTVNTPAPTDDVALPGQTTRSRRRAAS